MYYKKYCKIKEDLISDINFFAGLIEEPEERDNYDGYESVHYELCNEGYPDEYIVLDVKQYRKDYVLAYTNNDELINLYNGKRWKRGWMEIYEWKASYEIPKTLREVGDYIIKVPYNKIILEDLFLIANTVYDDYKICQGEKVNLEVLVRLVNSPFWESPFEELPDDD